MIADGGSRLFRAWPHGSPQVRVVTYHVCLFSLRLSLLLTLVTSLACTRAVPESSLPRVEQESSGSELRTAWEMEKWAFEVTGLGEQPHPAEETVEAPTPEEPPVTESPEEAVSRAEMARCAEFFELAARWHPDGEQPSDETQFAVCTTFLTLADHACGMKATTQAEFQACVAPASEQQCAELADDGYVIAELMRFISVEKCVANATAAQVACALAADTEEEFDVCYEFTLVEPRQYK